MRYKEVITWSTDGFFRETKEKVAYRKSEGCSVVEMECSALAAVSAFRDSFRITIKDGKVTEMTAPADAKVQRIKISSCGLSVYYSADAAFDYSNAVFFVNGKDQGIGAMHSMTDTANIYLMYRSISDYIPLDKLNTLEFSVKSNQD